MATPSDTGQAQREAASTSTRLTAEARDRANASANSAQVQALQAAVSSLPAPVNIAANGLSTAIYAVIRAKPLPTSSTSPASDPAKVFALGIAYAVLSTVWCFIKSILNPLPFIGSFFPLCEPDNNQQITRALASSREGEQQPSSGTVTGVTANTSPTVEQQGQPDPGRGLTFAEFLATTSITNTPSTTGNVSPPSSQAATVLLTMTGSNTPVQPTTQPASTANTVRQQQQDPTNSDALRRLFGI